MKRFDRVYYHYSELEDFHAGMWRATTGAGRKAHIEAAAALMRDSDAFLEAMKRAVDEWPKACEAAFTADAINHLAYLGHCGCCIAVGSPEEATRAGWHTLDTAEQDEANRVAQVALNYWEAKYSARGRSADLFSFEEYRRA